MKSQFFSRLTILGMVMIATGLLIVGCSNDDDGGGGGGSSKATQIDRMAVPGLNTALISSSLKDTYNQSDPSNDTANFSAEVTTNIANFRAAVSGVLGAEDLGVTPAQLTAIIIPDVVTIDFTQTVTFPNGRTLDDDVMDTVLQLVLNRSGVTDAVDNNDVPFDTAFPYMVAPN